MESVSDILLSEHPRVRREMVRLHETHNILGYALRLAVKEQLGEDASWEDVDHETRKHVARATALLIS